MRRQRPSTPLCGLALVVALADVAWARRAPEVLRLELADGCTSRAGACTLRAGLDGSCDVRGRLCVATTAGATRIRVRGTNGVGAAIVAALARLPEATPATRAVRFYPALAPGCVDAGRVVLPVGTRARLVIAGRVRDGHGGRALLRLSCAAGDAPPAPTPDPPPDPAPAPGPDPGPPPDPPGLRFIRQLIDPQGGEQLTSGVAAGDIDGDGRPDVVVSGFERLVWYRNPDWTRFLIADGHFGAGAKTVARDVDGDGRIDVVTGLRDTADHTVWLRNDPAGWQLHVLSDLAYCHELVFGDLDGDGRADGFCVDQLRGQIGFFVAPADPTAPWPFAPIDPGTNAMGSAIADIDGDGRLDVVAGLSWYRNEPTGAWTRVPYASVVAIPGYEGFANYAEISVVDVNGDRRPDLVATVFAETPVGQLYAFLAPVDPVHESWTPVLVDPGPLFGVHGQGVAPFDGSARPQVMVAETNIGGFGFGVNPDPHVWVYRLLGDPADPTAWERNAIDTTGTHDAQVVDVDGDGLPDVIGHEENTQILARFGAVQLWRNATVPAP